MSLVNQAQYQRAQFAEANSNDFNEMAKVPSGFLNSIMEPGSKYATQRHPFGPYSDRYCFPPDHLLKDEAKLDLLESALREIHGMGTSFEASSLQTQKTISDEARVYPGLNVANFARMFNANRAQHLAAYTATAQNNSGISFAPLD